MGQIDSDEDETQQMIKQKLVNGSQALDSFSKSYALVLWLFQDPSKYLTTEWTQQ